MKLIFKYEEYREVRLYEIRDQRRHDACGRNHFGGRGIYKLRKRCNGMDVSEYADADIRWRSRQDVHQGHIR